MSRCLVTSLAVLAAACGGSFGDPSGDGADGGDRAEDGGPTELIDYDPSNVPVDHMIVGTANVVFDADVTINTETGELTGPGAAALPIDNIFVVVPQADPDAPALGVYSWATLIIDSGVTVTVEGRNGLVFALNQSATINGIIDISAGRVSLAAPGPGGASGGDDITPMGAGLGGGTSLGNRDAGGGGAGFGDLGGEGGRQEGNPGGGAGIVVGLETNVPLFGGSGGARGGQTTGGGLGGGGGGAFQVSARGEVRFGPASGINASGAGGLGGQNDRGGGGGGSGGAVLLEGNFVVVDGLIATNGGGGGAGANQNNTGQPGAIGAFGPEPSPGGIGAGEGTNGGDGASGDTMVGQPGIAGNGNTGGGGGAGGRVYVRSREQAAISGMVSPSASLALGSL